ncbi:hypothetical protein CVT26_005442 [Gymnopilus dilepis]|uniref:Uncharacterized protein n=1 Tax=Gymnopilus dilepis TaxID=231916 RepID=A0A409WC67_9AGAR|nr:hypothetical protein CVT26_005442 [Gymnopilus dilepis]
MLVVSPPSLAPLVSMTHRDARLVGSSTLLNTRCDVAATAPALCYLADLGRRKGQPLPFALQTPL